MFVKDGIPLHGTNSDILKSILPTSCNGDPSVSIDDQDMALVEIENE